MQSVRPRDQCVQPGTTRGLAPGSSAPCLCATRTALRGGSQALRVAAACQDRQRRPVAVCKCPEARAWALPYMATALAIPSRDLVSVGILGTQACNHYSRAVRRDTNDRNLLSRPAFPATPFCSDLLACLTPPYAHTGCRLGPAPRPSPRALRQCVQFGFNFHARMFVPAALSQAECAKAFAVSASARTEGRAELIRRRGDNSAGR